MNPDNSGKPPQTASVTAALELEAFLPYRLSVLSNRMSQAIARIYAERFDLSITEWRLMAVLGRYPGLTAGELVERTAMDKVAVSRAVAGLMASSRVERGADDRDRRRVPLKLSTAGLEVYALVAPLALDYERSLLAGLSAAERSQLEHLVERLLAASEGAEARLRGMASGPEASLKDARTPPTRAADSAPR
ncbi:MAG: MarR family winged helix-turn-helix transcriptional regulator [Aquimonas sp.]|nr:MarR family winged helix-turn-helix transcriptional regulator [Aquimonas sp.]